MKHLILCLTALFAFICHAQNKYITKVGEVTFEASTPSWEKVKATNKNTTAILNADNGQFASLVLVKAFRFKNALMEEHFNENYAESDDYPKATLKAKIANFTANNSKTTFTGNLSFHGKTITLKDQPVEITQDNDVIILEATFTVNVADFDIDIPRVVSKKIAQQVMVHFKFILNKK